MSVHRRRSSSSAIRLTRLAVTAATLLGTLAVLVATNQPAGADGVGTISTVVGGPPSGQPARSIALDPDSVVVDATTGDLFVSEATYNVVYEVSPSGTETVFAGGGANPGTCSGSVDGVGDGCAATSAQLNLPFGMAVDANGDLFIADEFDHRVRMVAAATCAASCAFGLPSTTAGDIYTVAGDGAQGSSGDSGLATSAKLDNPSAVAIDTNGDLLIADAGNNKVRMVAATPCVANCSYGLTNTTANDIYTVAGNGTSGYAGDSGPATSAELSLPSGVGVDSSGNLLVADTNNNRVRMVAFVSCAVSCPYGIAPTVAGDIYTVAGGGSSSPGDGGSATSAELSGPFAVTVDGSHDLVIADSADNRVRIVAASTCASGCPYGLASTTAGDIYTVAGDGTGYYHGDGGPATSADVNNPTGAAVDASGDVLIAEAGGGRVRIVAAANCPSSCAFGLPSTTADDIYTAASNGSFGYSGDGGPATNAELESPRGVVVDATGDLLIADTGNSRVRMVAAASCSSGCAYGLPSTTAGDIYTVAGDGTYGYSGDSGPARSAELRFPVAVTLDGSGDLLIADSNDNRARMVAAGTCSSSCPYGLASTTAGDIYTVAGNGTSGYSGDGISAASSELNGPSGVAVDPTGDLLIADANNARLRLVASTTCSSSCPYGLPSTTAGDIYTVAGDGTSGYSGDLGPAASAELRSPTAVAVDLSGDLVIADGGDNRVRLVAANTCSSGCPYGLTSTAAADIYTVAGNGTGGGSGDGGPATDAELRGPGALAVDGSGDLVIADSNNSRVRLVAAATCGSGCPYGIASMTVGDIYPVAGTGTIGFSGDGGAAASATLVGPRGVAVDTTGDLFIGDSGNGREREVIGSTATHLAVSTPPPAKSPVESYFALSIAVEDYRDDPVTPDHSTVALALTPSSGTPGASLTCTGGESKAAVNGVANFSCSIDQAGTGYTLTATDGSLAEAVTAAFEITQATPSVSTSLSRSSPVLTGTSVRDAATLTGATSHAGGTIAYGIFSDAACTKLVRSLTPSPNAVSDGKAPNSNSYTFGTVGTFYFLSTYSGDANNAGPVASTCGSEKIVVLRGPPTVASVFPSSGPGGSGTTVTVEGTNLTGASAVRFGQTASPSFRFLSDSSLIATVPSRSPGTVDVTVTTSRGTSAISAADRFTYTQGYWLAVRTGGVYGAGAAASLGGVPSSVATAANPVVGIAGNPDGRGYVVATANGTVRAFGDAKFYGDLPSHHVDPNLPVVAVAETADGRGYWLLASDGGFFAFGDAKYRGSVPGLGQKVSDVVAMEASPDGAGYWMAGADGKVWDFGSAGFYGDLPSLHVHPNLPVVAMLPSSTGKGYVLVASDGGTFKFGSGARFYGSLPGIGVKVTDVIGLALTPDDGGYYIAAANGHVWPFGDAKPQKAPAGLTSHLPVVSIAGL